MGIYRVVEWINAPNGLDYFLMFGSVAAVSATTLGKILIYPQLSHVGYLIFICNLTVINCYANIRYSITHLGSNYLTKWIPISSSSLILD